MITCKSYFSGAGGLDHGLRQAGIEIIQSIEIDKTRCKTLRMNFDHPVLCENMEGVTVLDQPESEIMVATYPCKEYSAASNIHKSDKKKNKKSKKSEDGKIFGDHLFLHFFRHVALARPEMFFIENVPDMKKYPVVMEAFTKLPDYYIHVECPIDSLTWLPQKRKRLFVFGSKKPMYITAPKRKSVSLKAIIEPDPVVDLPQYVIDRYRGKYRDGSIISDPSVDSYAPCCIAHYSKDKSTRLVKCSKSPIGVRPWTPREYARLQGFPDDFKFAGAKSSQYAQIGDAVSVDAAQWAGEQMLRYFHNRCVA